MINQKAISFKIYLDNLEGIDEFVKNCPYFTTRNRELNKAVAAYLEMQSAREWLNHTGETSKAKSFIEHYLHSNPGRLFD